MKKSIIISFLLVIAMQACLFTASAQDASKPYNPDANAKADLKKAVELAKKENKNVLIQIGGNWCPWCLRFHALATSQPKIDSIINRDYVYMLLNYSKENKNMDVMEQLGFPNRFGFPVFVILDGDGKRLNTQDSGFLEHCREKGYDTTKVVTFLSQWSIKAIDPTTYKSK